MVLLVALVLSRHLNFICRQSGTGCQQSFASSVLLSIRFKTRQNYYHILFFPYILKILDIDGNNNKKKKSRLKLF